MTEGANPCLRKSLRNLVVIPGKPAIAGAIRNPEGTRGLDSRAPGSYESVPATYQWISVLGPWYENEENSGVL